MKKVAILGACGRIGLPLTYIVGKAGHEVTAIDPKTVSTDYTNLQSFPYMEEGIESSNWKEVFKKITWTDQYDPICDADTVLVIIGTPVDAENNARVDMILDLFDKAITPRLKHKSLVILRSTVSPGFTDMLIKRVEEATLWKEGVDFYMVHAPERVAQGHSLKETTELPQIIGTQDGFGNSYYEALKFFRSLGIVETHVMDCKEAEYAKLMTNMYRYVNIALANEFYMMGARDGVDIHKVIKMAGYNYPRMAMPQPGPNAAGPCLFKDGKLLLDRVPYGDLLNVAFHINEGMPQFILDLALEKAKEIQTEIKTATIIGAAFKPNNDDTRFSESFKLKKLLEKLGIKVSIYDPLVPDHKNKITYIPADSDAYFVMTPHDKIVSMLQKVPMKKNAILVDAWKKCGLIFNEYSPNGVYVNV